MDFYLNLLFSFHLSFFLFFVSVGCRVWQCGWWKPSRGGRFDGGESSTWRLGRRGEPAVCILPLLHVRQHHCTQWLEEVRWVGGLSVRVLNVSVGDNYVQWSYRSSYVHQVLLLHILAHQSGCQYFVMLNWSMLILVTIFTLSFPLLPFLSPPPLPQTMWIQHIHSSSSLRRGRPSSSSGSRFPVGREHFTWTSSQKGMNLFFWGGGGYSSHLQNCTQVNCQDIVKTVLIWRPNPMSHPTKKK